MVCLKLPWNFSPRDNWPEPSPRAFKSFVQNTWPDPRSAMSIKWDLDGQGSLHLAMEYDSITRKRAKISTGSVQASTKSSSFAQGLKRRARSTLRLFPRCGRVVFVLWVSRFRCTDRICSNKAASVSKRMSVCEIADIAATHAYFYQQCALERIRASVLFYFHHFLVPVLISF